MNIIDILKGTVHNIPADLRAMLASDTKARTQWNTLTPLARNEWICWITFVKKDETRLEHLKRARTELKDGKRRPCCWLGCTHRKDKAISPSVQAVLNGTLGTSKKVKRRVQKK